MPIIMKTPHKSQANQEIFNNLMPKTVLHYQQLSPFTIIIEEKTIVLNADKVTFLGLEYLSPFKKKFFCQITRDMFQFL